MGLSRVDISFAFHVLLSSEKTKLCSLDEFREIYESFSKISPCEKCGSVKYDEKLYLPHKNIMTCDCEIGVFTKTMINIDQGDSVDDYINKSGKLIEVQMQANIVQLTNIINSILYRMKKIEMFVESTNGIINMPKNSLCNDVAFSISSEFENYPMDFSKYIDMSVELQEHDKLKEHLEFAQNKLEKYYKFSIHPYLKIMEE